VTDATVLSFEEPAAAPAPDAPALPAWAATVRAATMEQHAGNIEASLALIEQAIKENAPEALVLCLQGGVHQRQHQWAEALPYFLRARELADDNPMMFMNIGVVLFEMGNFEGARDYFRAALAREFRFPNAWLKLAASNLLLQNWFEALACYERAVAMDPNDFECQRGLATVLSTLGHDEAALHHYRTAADLNPQDAEAEAGAGFTLLRLGRWTEGWKCFEARWRLMIRRAASPEYRGAPLFTGKIEELRGKRVLLREEQGFGDSIHFSRYIAPLSKIAATVIVESSPPMQRLMAQIVGVGEQFLRNEPAPKFDHQTSLMSLPLLFGTTPETCPSPTDFGLPYHRTKLHQEEPLVGLCWAGGERKHDPMANAIDVRRSVAREKFDPLFAAVMRAGAGPVSLQLEDLQSYGVKDWHDTMRILLRCSLIITVDTAVAHLAGSLGVPVWMLSRADSCWRWMNDREDTPWYPTMRIYRQKRLNEWAPVIERVTADLMNWEPV
jgi:tetratricopeptide (TPR) repeat protein